MKIIRWWGIAVFFGLVVLIALIWFLIAPKLISDSIQSIGTEILGAKVEVADVELQLNPLAISIHGLAATDPDKPMENLVELQKIKVAVDSGALLWKKLVVDELAIEGARLATPRKTSGALSQGRKSAQAVDKMVKLVLPDGEQLDVQAMVEKADLLTVKRINTFNAQQKEIQQEWQQALDKDAFDNRIAALEKEYQRLAARLKDNKLNLLKDKSDWKKLKENIDAERKQIKVLSGKLKDDKQQLSDQLSLVKKGPQDDLDKLMNNLGLGSGVDGLVDKYLGPQYTPWVNKILAMTKEMQAKSQQQTNEAKAMVLAGEKVVFKDKMSFPQILVKKVTLTGGDASWNMDGRGFDLGYLPWITGQPAKMSLKLDGERQATFDLSSQWTSSREMKTRLTSQVKQWPIKSLPLMQTEKGDWTINSGDFRANVEGLLTLEDVDFKASLSIQSPQLSYPEGLGDWQSSLAASINQQSSIELTLTAKGSVSDPSIKLSSSLEGLFKSAIGEKLKQKAQALKGKAQQAIADKVGDLSSLEAYRAKFAEWETQVNDKDKLLQDILGKIKL